MQTIPDSNIVLDLISGESAISAWSRKKLEDCAQESKLLTNAVVFAESSATFAAWQDSARIFEDLEFVCEDIAKDVAHLAGRIHAEYRRKGGQRGRTLPDFFTGAHAVVSNSRILTRDIKRYRSYFPDVKIIAPDTHP
jgi:predicted nucleic acid-binding protein